MTGIYGGSFNPIHKGHTALGLWLVRQGLVDELWFLVSPQNPLKPVADLLADEERLRLAQLALDDVARSPEAADVADCLRVSDFEFHLPRPSYMVHTLEAMRTAWPDREFALVIGADNWLRFPQWFRADEILRHHPIIVYPRPGYPVDAATLPQGVQLVEAPLMPFASTAIRKAIATQPDYHGEGLSPAVWEAIEREHFYRPVCPRT